MHIILLEGPKEEPLGLEEVKAHLRLTGDHEDALLNFYIQMSRSSLESYLQKSFLTQIWKISIPSCEIEERRRVKKDFSYALPYGPVRKIVEAQWVSYNTDIRPQVLEQTHFISFDQIVVKGKVPQESILEVIYQAGLSETRDKIPSSIQGALLLMVTQFFEQKSLNEMSWKEDKSIKNLLSTYRSWRL